MSNLREIERSGREETTKNPTALDTVTDPNKRDGNRKIWMNFSALQQALTNSRLNIHRSYHSPKEYYFIFITVNEYL